MQLFNNDTATEENRQVRAISKGITDKNTPFDVLRRKMIKTLKNA